MHDATESFHYPVKVRQPLRLELKFIFPLKHVNKLFVLGERMFSIEVGMFARQKNQKD